MDTKHSVCALVVTYNRKRLLKENIEALLRQTTPCCILVGDNASSDGTKEMLQPWIDAGQITYFNTGSNLGGAGGFQFLIKKAHELGFSHLWIMDDDSIPKPTALQELLKIASEHPDYGYLSSLALWTDGSACKMNQQKFFRQAESLKHGEIPCKQATFVSLLLNASALSKAGLPYKEFFIWGDDVEFTRRLSSQFDCYYVPSSMVVHKTVNNEGSNIAKDDSDRLDRYRYAYRNEVFIARQEKGSRILYQAAKILLHTARVLVSGKPQKARKLKIIWGSSLKGLTFHPQIEYPKPRVESLPEARMFEEKQAKENRFEEKKEKKGTRLQENQKHKEEQSKEKKETQQPKEVKPEDQPKTLLRQEDKAGMRKEQPENQRISLDAKKCEETNEDRLPKEQQSIQTKEPGLLKEQDEEVPSCGY